MYDGNEFGAVERIADHLSSAGAGPRQRLWKIIAKRSLLFTGVKMGSYSSVNEGVILPYCNIGRGAHLNRVIVDSGVRIPEGLVVGEDPELDAKRFRRSESGVCLITRDMIEKLKV